MVTAPYLTRPPYSRAARFSTSKKLLSNPHRLFKRLQPLPRKLSRRIPGAVGDEEDAADFQDVVESNPAKGALQEDVDVMERSGTDDDESDQKKNAVKRQPIAPPGAVDVPP